MESEGASEHPRLSVEMGRKVLTTLFRVRMREIGGGSVREIDGALVLERISCLRNRLWKEMAVSLPGVQFRDNFTLPIWGFVIKMAGVEVARHEMVGDCSVEAVANSVAEKLESAFRTRLAPRGAPSLSMMVAECRVKLARSLILTSEGLRDLSAPGGHTDGG